MVVFLHGHQSKAACLCPNFSVSVEHSITFQFVIITASINVFFGKGN